MHLLFALRICDQGTLFLFKLRFRTNNLFLSDNERSLAVKLIIIFPGLPLTRYLITPFRVNEK